MTTHTPIRYRIAVTSPEAHQFEIHCHVADPDAAGQCFTLPVWIPGSYLVREFARNIVSIRAESAGQVVALTKLDKQRWQAAPVKGELTLIYTVYAFDLSVRSAYLDSQRGFFNGTSVFLAVEGKTDRPCEVEMVGPSAARYANWKVATSLPEAGAARYGFGTYRAKDYDDLTDHPVELGDFTLATFEACGVPHDIVFAGRHNADMDRLCTDFKKICEYQIRLFGEPAPFDRYVFMTVVLGDGYGGLEHRASTALVCSRDSLPAAGETDIKTNYRQFLGLVSHEYFHSWNVKRIKPASYAPYNLSQENYTRLLWAFEGLTSYYDDLTLVRTGLIDAASYLELLSQTITGVLRTPGRLVQNLEDSSFDTWIKYYRQDENSPNSGVSYYTKGAMVGLALDLTIRQKTQGAKSLDDVMQLLWQRYGRDFYEGGGKGVGETEWETVAEEATGLDLKGFFNHALRSTEDLPLPELLASAGVKWQLRAPQSGTDRGGWLDKPKAGGVTIGAKLGSDSGLVKLTHIFNGGPAEEAGLAANDVLVAIDGLKASQANLDAALAKAKVGDKLDILAFRRDELIATRLTLQVSTDNTVGLACDDSDADKIARRRAWIGV
ncbi:M61 family metallopeptidase [Parachitinimonas caeni]|uniref:PDZ domain-containing protein n=1 Tax=Parachitinimonas caeni TaxID=3031301 RepID=A0ABT7E018_9NEIS|nr:PDZ domain-containing protein [Parachitinimonas caeni]MDK2125640.1 PDZ domain-containing protein [Parachitinimonas caeni]